LYRKDERAARTRNEIRFAQEGAQDALESIRYFGFILAGALVVAVIASVVRDFLIALQTTPVC
jgi:hypothetical protein